MLNRIKMRRRALFRKEEVERELEEELRFHLEREAAQNLRNGMNPEDAHYSALKSFGAIDRSKEECRDARGVRLIEEFLQDLRYGKRLLAKNPGVTLIARFGSDPAIVGRQLRIDGRSLTVVGVMPPDFRFPFQSDLWWLSDRYFNRQTRSWRIDQTIGRLKPGVSPEHAQAEMKEIAVRLAQAYPDTNAEVTATVVPLRDFWFGKIRRSFWLLLGACGFVLLIACANVANLLMTQATVRERELAVRAALGASQGRLIRQSVAEALLLVSIACAGGIVLGAWSLRMLVALLPEELLPFFVKIELDGRVLAFTLVVSVFTALFVGLIPALRMASVDLDQSLREGGKFGTGAGLQRIRGLLVVTEIALAVVLLAGAGLMLRTFTRLQNTSPGFNAEGVLHLEINPT